MQELKFKDKVFKVYGKIYNLVKKLLCVDTVSRKKEGKFQ